MREFRNLIAWESLSLPRPSIFGVIVTRSHALSVRAFARGAFKNRKTMFSCAHGTSARASGLRNRERRAFEKRMMQQQYRDGVYKRVGFHFAHLFGKFANRGIVKAKILAVSLLLSGAIGQAQPQQASAQGRELATASLSGRVVDREDKETRLANVRVTLYREPNATALRETLTEIDGSYVFPQLPAGWYTIRASSPGWLATSFGQQKPGRSGVLMVLGGGESRKDLTIMLFRGGVITGRIRSENGQALVGAVIEAFQLRHSATGSQIYAIQSTNTDDRGEYRLIGLSPGEYFVRAIPSVGGRLFISGQSLNVQRGRQRGYAPMFFPAAMSPGEAGAITVGVGDTLSGIDITFAAVPLAQISGALIGLPGPPKNIIFRRLFDDGLLRAGETIESEVSPDGRFVMTNLRPGPVTLLVRNTGDTVQDVSWALTRLVVDGDASGVNIQMRPGLTVSGEVRFLSTLPSAPSTANLSFMLRASGPGAVDTGTISTGAVAKDGSFSLGGLMPGSYFLEQQNRTAWAIASIRQGGIERVLSNLDVQGDVSDVVVTLIDRPASLSGRLIVPADALVTDYTVLAFPADPAVRISRPRAIYSASLDTTGRFTMPSMLPGDYLVAVTDDIEVNAWFDPRVLEQLSQGGIAVRIAAGEAKTQDLSVRKR